MKTVTRKMEESRKIYTHNYRIVFGNLKTKKNLYIFYRSQKKKQINQTDHSFTKKLITIQQRWKFELATFCANDRSLIRQPFYTKLKTRREAKNCNTETGVILTVFIGGKVECC